MITEKVLRPLNGFMMLLVFFLITIVGITGIATQAPILIILSLITIIPVLPGFMIINPNESKVLILFGNDEGYGKVGF